MFSWPQYKDYFSYNNPIKLETNKMTKFILRTY